MIRLESVMFPAKTKKELAQVSFNQARMTMQGRREKRGVPLESGYAYLVKDDVEKAYKVFMESASSGSEGLIITREYPPRIRRKYGLEKTRVLWLSPEKDDTQQTLNTLQDISLLISDFTRKAGQGIILLDGIEYLATNFGFEATIHFLQSKRSQIEMTDNILITPIIPGAFPSEQVKLIEREFGELSLTSSKGGFTYAVFADLLQGWLKTAFNHGAVYISESIRWIGLQLMHVLLHNKRRIGAIMSQD